MTPTHAQTLAAIAVGLLTLLALAAVVIATTPDWSLW